MKYEAKSVVFGRMPRKEGCDFKTAFFKIYDKINPMSPEVMSSFPMKEVEFPNIEAVVINSSGLRYFLEGNDLVFDNIKAIEIKQEEQKLTISIE